MLHHFSSDSNALINFMPGGGGWQGDLTFLWDINVAESVVERTVAMRPKSVHNPVTNYF